MSTIALALLVAGSVGIHVEHIEGLSSDQGDALAQTIAQVAEVAAGAPAKLDARGAPACGAKDQCARDVRVRTGANHVLFVSAYGAVSKIALFLELYEEGKPPTEKRIDLEIAERTWRPALVKALSGLLPKAPKKEVAVAPPPPPPPVVEKKPARVEAPPIAERNATPPPQQPKKTVAVAAAPTETRTSKPTKPIAMTIVKWSTVGAGVVVGIAGAVLVAGTYSDESDLERKLDRSRNSETGLIERFNLEDAQAEADEIAGKRTTGAVITALGAAAIGGGLLWIFAFDDDADTRAAATIAPLRDGAAISFAGSF